MNPEHLAEALELAGKLECIFVATADARRVPHLAIAERIGFEGKDLVGVTAWFCPRTVENVGQNSGITLVIWDRRQDTGFQLIGEVVQVLDLAILDGFMPEGNNIAQIERKLLVRVDHIQNFSHAHHSDTDLP